MNDEARAERLKCKMAEFLTRHEQRGQRINKRKKQWKRENSLIDKGVFCDEKI